MFEAYFFDQGRVDAILLRADGHTMFIDAGFRSDGLACVKKLRALGVTRLDAYLASHLHKNHVGGAAPIVEAFVPDTLYAGREKAWATLLKYAASGAERTAIKRAAHRVLKVGDQLALGGASITCLGPPKQRKCSPGDYAENYNSLILKVAYGERTLLLTGDTTSAI